jgi:hypothetical protein
MRVRVRTHVVVVSEGQNVRRLVLAAVEPVELAKTRVAAQSDVAREALLA